MPSGSRCGSVPYPAPGDPSYLCLCGSACAVSYTWSHAKVSRDLNIVGSPT